MTELTITPKTRHYWQSFYAKHLDFGLDISDILIPTEPEIVTPPVKLLVMPIGMGIEKALQLWENCFPETPVVLPDHWSPRDVIHNDRIADETYAVWIHDGNSPDPIDMNKTAEESADLRPVTLAEQLISMLEFRIRTGMFMDIVPQTLCAGSRCKDGSVMTVCHAPVTKEVYIGKMSPNTSGKHIGIRRTYGG